MKIVYIIIVYFRQPRKIIKIPNTVETVKEFRAIRYLNMRRGVRYTSITERRLVAVVGLEASQVQKTFSYSDRTKFDHTSLRDDGVGHIILTSS